MSDNQHSNDNQGRSDSEMLRPSCSDRFSKEERVCIAHALHHLMANKIADTTTFSGWYSGDKRVFVKRHKKAIEVLNGFLSPNTKLRDEA